MVGEGAEVGQGPGQLLGLPVLLALPVGLGADLAELLHEQGDGVDPNIGGGLHSATSLSASRAALLTSTS